MKETGYKGSEEEKRITIAFLQEELQRVRDERDDLSTKLERVPKYYKLHRHMKETGPGGYTSVIQKQLMSATGLVLKKYGTMYEGSGWPDFYVPSPIWHGWIELKCGDNTCSPAQKRKIRLLLRNSVPAIVLRMKRFRGCWVETFEDCEGTILERRMSSNGKDLLFELKELFRERGDRMMGIDAFDRGE